MRLTIRTNLAMRTLMYCAVNDGHNVTKCEIARACNASENHLAQIVRLLHHEGFIEAVRGRRGGLRLARRAEEIFVGDVFRLFEAELPFAECFKPEENTCPLIACCWLRPALVRAIEAFYGTLDDISLAELVAGNDPLQELLRDDMAGVLRMQCGPRREGAGEREVAGTRRGTEARHARADAVFN